MAEYNIENYSLRLKYKDKEGKNMIVYNFNYNFAEICKNVFMKKKISENKILENLKVPSTYLYSIVWCQLTISFSE